MAMIEAGMCCGICGRPISDPFGLEAFALPCLGIQHPIFRDLDDAAVHQKCIKDWEHKTGFVEHFNGISKRKIEFNESGGFQFATQLQFSQRIRLAFRKYSNALCK